MATNNEQKNVQKTAQELAVAGDNLHLQSGVAAGETRETPMAAGYEEQLFSENESSSDVSKINFIRCLYYVMK